MMRRPTILVVMLCAAATSFAALAATTSVKDASGRMVEVRDASRIISIGGAVTEILYALNLDDRVIAVDTTSLYPERALKDKPNVGYMRQLSPEGVLGLGPSLVLAADGAGPKEAVAVLEAASVPFVRVPDHFNGEGIVERIRLIAAATGTVARGECLAASVRAELDAMAQLRSQVQKPARVMFVLSFMNGKPMVAGKGTAADGIIALAGAVNAVSEFDGYKIVSDESIVAARPDVVLAMARHNFTVTTEEVFQHPAFSLTPAAKDKSLITMDGLYLLGFGPRTARAAGDLARAVYPALKTFQVASENAGSGSCRE